MADNTELTAGSGGDTIATDDIAGVKHQRVKIQYGDDGSATDVSDTNPLPIDDAGGSLSVDDGGGALTVDGTVTANLAAGTNNIGDVDVLSVVPGTGATNLGKAEDAAHTTGDTGVMSLAVRLDSGASLADTDGDYAPLQVDSSGALRVTGGGGGTEYTVDAAAPAAPVGTASLMERDDALSALTEVEGDWTNMRSNANGALWVKHDGTVTVDGSGVTQPVSGTVSVTGVATAANQTTIIGHVDGIEGLLTTIDGDTGTLAVTGGGTETGALRVTVANNSTGVLSVDDNGSTLSVDDGGASLTVDNGGTFAVQAAQSGTWTVQPGNTANTTAWKVDASSVAVPVTDNSGSLTVDNAGTFVVQDNQVVADNAGFTDGTTKVFVSGYVYDEVAGTALTENDAGAARMNVNRAQVGIIEDGSTRGRYATVTAANALKVDASGVAVPITDNSGSITVDNSGTFAVQDSEKVADNGGFTDGTTKVLPAGFIFDEVAGTALTENDVAAARIDSKRAAVGVLEDATTRGQRAAVSAAGRLSVDGSGVTQPVSYATTGSGNATGALRVELANNGTGTLSTVSTVSTVSSVTAIGTSVTPGTSAAHLGKAVDSATGATDTGVAALALRDDVLTTLTPANDDYTHLRTNLRGAVWVFPDTPPTGSSILVARNIDVDETEDAIKATAGTLWGYYFANTTGSALYVKLYNATVASVTVGSTTPFLTMLIPAGSVGHEWLEAGVPFDTAITVAATTGIADADTGAPATNACIFNAYYT